jgi:hypothetical protein
MKFFHQLFANLHAVSTTFLLHHGGQFILNYKLTEDTKKSMNHQRHLSWLNCIYPYHF